MCLQARTVGAVVSRKAKFRLMPFADSKRKDEFIMGQTRYSSSKWFQNEICNRVTVEHHDQDSSRSA